MGTVTDHIREEIRVALVRRRLSQSKLAERTGLTRQHISAMLSGRRGHIPNGWQKILDELELELIVRPKKQEPLG